MSFDFLYWDQQQIKFYEVKKKMLSLNSVSNGGGKKKKNKKKKDCFPWVKNFKAATASQTSWCEGLEIGGGSQR